MVYLLKPGSAAFSNLAVDLAPALLSPRCQLSLAAGLPHQGAVCPSARARGCESRIWAMPSCEHGDQPASLPLSSELSFPEAITWTHQAFSGNPKGSANGKLVVVYFGN